MTSTPIESKFTLGRYNFVVYGTSLEEVTYKVTPIPPKMPSNEKFYNDILNNEKISIGLELTLGLVILDKKGFITVIKNEDGTDNYFMVLHLRVTTIENYAATYIGSGKVTPIINEFYPEIINNATCPVYMTVNKIMTGENNFMSSYMTSVSISHIDDRESAKKYIFTKLFPAIDNAINTSINGTNKFKIGFEKHYVFLQSYASIRIVGYLTPKFINGIKVSHISDTQIVINESPKWMKGKLNSSINPADKINIYDVIPYIYNTPTLVFLPTAIAYSDRYTFENNNVVQKITFDSVLFVFENGDRVDVSKFKSCPVRFFPYISNEHFTLYRNQRVFGEFKYIAAINHPSKSEFGAFLNVNLKKYDKYRFADIYSDTERNYTLLMKAQKNKSIYNSFANIFKSEGNKK